MSRTLGNPYFDPLAEAERLQEEFFGPKTTAEIAAITASLAQKAAVMAAESTIRCAAARAADKAEAERLRVLRYGPRA